MSATTGLSEEEYIYNILR